MAQVQDALPFVSVIIPAYDAVSFLPEAIASALGQTWPSREVILVNDGSPEREALEGAIAHFRPEITYIWQPNGGPGAARNAGLRVARGGYVAFLDSDDYWEPDFLREQMTMFAEDRRLDLVYCDGWIRGDTPFAGRRFMERYPSRGPVTVGALLTCACTVFTSGVVARTAVLRAAGGFNESLRRGQDFDLWLRLARRGARLGYQRKALVHRRMHASNLSRDPMAVHHRVINVLTQPCWRDLPERDRRLLAARLAYHHGALALTLGKRAIVEGRFEEAREHLAAAAAANRGWKLKAARVALRIAPHLLRGVCVRRAGSNTPHAAGTTDMPAVRSSLPTPAAARRIGTATPTSK